MLWDKYMSKKSICKNCGDPVGDDRNSDEFCSGQCRVEYELEHDRK
jgi:predicted nucleic acid-binding Zn ribbon protein